MPATYVGSKEVDVSDLEDAAATNPKFWFGQSVIDLEFELTGNYRYVARFYRLFVTVYFSLIIIVFAVSQPKVIIAASGVIGDTRNLPFGKRLHKVESHGTEVFGKRSCSGSQVVRLQPTSL